LQPALAHGLQMGPAGHERNILSMVREAATEVAADSTGTHHGYPHNRATFLCPPLNFPSAVSIEAICVTNQGLVLTPEYRRVTFINDGYSTLIAP